MKQVRGMKEDIKGMLRAEHFMRDSVKSSFYKFLLIKVTVLWECAQQQTHSLQHVSCFTAALKLERLK